MDQETRKRIYNVLGASMRAQNLEFRKIWEKVFQDLMMTVNNSTRH